jgi:ribosomal protein L29
MKSTEELKQIRSKNSKELIGDLKKEYDKAREANFDLQFRKNKNIKSLHAIRTKIARIWTVINEKITEENNTQRSK